MAKFNFDIRLNADVTSVEQARVEVNRLKQSIKDVKQGNVVNIDSNSVRAAEANVKALERAIERAEVEGGQFGTIFRQEFGQAMTAINLTEKEVKDLNRQLAVTQARALQAAKGVNQLSTSAKLATQNIKATNEYMDRLKNNMFEGVGQTIAFGAIGGFTAAIASAVTNVTRLDKVMTDVSIVSGKSREEMEAYRDAAGEASNILGTTAKEYLEASLIYEQQGGMAADYATDLAKATIIASNITGDSTADMSEYLTAVINGFKLLETEGTQAGMKVADVLSYLGAISGSGLNEMAEALQRTSEVAQTAGYELEDISSAIAVVSEVTRRTPQTIGTAFKSILLSFTQLREGSEEEVNAFTNKVENAFQLAGLKDMSIFDVDGNLKDAQVIMREIGDRWETLSKEAQSLLSEAIAGKYQAEVFQAFMANQERYHELMESAYDAEGVATRQQMIYMDSLDAKINQLKNSWQSASSAMISEDIFANMIESASSLLNSVGAIENSFVATVAAAAPLVGIMGALFGGRFAAQAKQAEAARDFSKNVEDRLEKEGKLTDELKEQLQVGNEQQKVVRNLGNHAGQIYKENQENLKKLREELSQIDDIGLTMAEKVENASNSIRQGNTPKHIDSGAVSRVQSEARTRAEESIPEIAQLQSASKPVKDLSDELVKLKRNADFAMSSLAPDSGEQERLYVARQSVKEIQTTLEPIRGKSEDIDAVLDLIHETLNNNNAAIEDFQTLQNASLEVAKDMLKPYEDRLKTVKEINAEMIEQQALEARNSEIQRQIEFQEGLQRSPEEIEQEIALAEASNATMEQSADGAEKWRRMVEGVSTAAVSVIPVITMLNAVQEESISTSEFWRGSIQSISTSLMLLPHPAFKAIGAIGMLSSVLFDFKNAKESLIDGNNEILRSFVSLTETTSGALSDIRSVKEDYKALFESGASATDILTNGTEEARESYKKLAETVANSSPEMVKYYNAEGIAIIDTTKAYEELHQAKLEDVRLTNEMLVNNREGFLQQYVGDLNTLSNKQNEASTSLHKLQKELKQAQEQDNSKRVKELLGEIQKLNQTLADTQSSMHDTRGAIQANLIVPVIEASKAISSLKGSTEEGAKAAADALSELGSSLLDPEKINEMASAGAVDQIQSLIKLSEDMIDLMSTKSAEEITEYTKKLSGLLEADPVKFSYAIREAKGELGEFLSIMEGDQTSSSIMVDTLNEVTFAMDALRNQSRETDEEVRNITDSITAIGANSGIAATGITGLSLALAPATGGISLLAGVSAAAGASLIGSTAAAIAHSKELQNGLRVSTALGKEQIKSLQRLDNITSAYEEAGRTAEGFNKGMEDVRGLQKQRKAMEDIMSFNPKSSKFIEGVEDLRKEFPLLESSMVKAMESGKSATEGMADSFSEVTRAQNHMIAGLMMNNADYYQTWQQENQGTIDFISANYQIDAENFATLGEYKSALSAMSASEFATYESEKLLSAQASNQGIAEDTHGTMRSTNEMYQSGVQGWLSTLNWFSSESLTISDKITIIFYMIIDAVKNSVKGAMNWIKTLWNSFVEFSFDAAQGITDAIRPLLEIFDKLVGTDFSKGITNMQNKMKDSLLAKVDEKDRSTLAEDFARQSAANNERRKRQAIEDAINNSNHSDTLGAFNGYDLRQDPRAKDRYGDAVKKLNEGPEKMGKPEKQDKDKDKKKKEVKDLDLELDRYYKLNNALSVIDEKLKSVSRSKGQAYGKDKISAMSREQAQYAAQIKVMQTYQNELQKEKQEKRAYLMSQGFRFDGDEISNLNERLRSAQNAANKLSEEAKEKAIENVKKLQAEAARYTEITYKLIPDKRQAIEDAKNAIKALEREKVEYKVKLVVDKNDLMTQVRDLMKEINDEQYDRHDEDTVIIGQQLTKNIEMMRYYQNLMNEVKKNQNLTDHDRQELLQQYQKDMLSAASSANASYKELAETQSKFISQTIEMIETADEGFSKIADKADRLAEAFKNAYGSSNFQEVSKIRDAQLKALDAQIIAASRARDEMIRYRDTLKEGTAQWKEANTAVADLGETIDGALVNKIDVLKTKFEEFMEGLLKASDKEVFGIFGLTGYEEELERASKQQDKMLNTFEKITKIGEVIAEVNEAISNSTDPRDAEKYKKFKEEELESLMKSDEVSAAQLERAKLLWDLEQKKQAMEDRKNASRMAQLIRDENGNMTYEYVRKEVKEDSKSSKDVLKASDDLYSFDRDQAKKAQDEVLEIIKNTNSKIQDIFQNQELSEAERKAAIERIKEQAIKDLDSAQKDMLQWTGYAMKDGVGSLKNMFQLGEISFDTLGVEDESVKKIFDAMDSGLFSIEDMVAGNVSQFADQMGLTAEEAQRVVSAILSATGSEINNTTQQLISTSNEWVNNFSSTLGKLEEYYTQTQANIKDTTDALKNSTGNLNQQITENTKSTEANMKAIIAQTDQMIGATRATDNATISYKNLTDSLVGRNGASGTLGAMIGVRDEMQKKLQGALTETKKRTDSLSASAGPSGATKSLNAMGQSANYSFNMSKQFDSATITTANNNIKHMSTYAKGAADNVYDLGQKALVSRSNIAGLSTALAALPGLNAGKKHYYTVTHKDGSITSESYKEKLKNPSSGAQYVGYFDTGGMYGDWAGSSGNQKPIPAFLHEKELVLNKGETENFLESLKIQRMLLSKHGTMTGLFSKLANKDSSSSDSSIQQDISINANFPNVQSSEEIEDALGNLSLRAAMFAHKNK